MLLWWMNLTFSSFIFLWLSGLLSEAQVNLDEPEPDPYAFGPIDANTFMPTIEPKNNLNRNTVNAPSLEEHPAPGSGEEVSRGSILPTGSAAAPQSEAEEDDYDELVENSPTTPETEPESPIYQDMSSVFSPLPREPEYMEYSPANQGMSPVVLKPKPENSDENDKVEPQNDDNIVPLPPKSQPLSRMRKFLNVIKNIGKRPKSSPTNTVSPTFPKSTLRRFQSENILSTNPNPDQNAKSKSFRQKFMRSIKRKKKHERQPVMSLADFQHEDFDEYASVEDMISQDPLTASSTRPTGGSKTPTVSGQQTFELQGRADNRRQARAKTSPIPERDTSGPALPDRSQFDASRYDDSRSRFQIEGRGSSANTVSQKWLQQKTGDNSENKPLSNRDQFLPFRKFGSAGTLI